MPRFERRGSGGGGFRGGSRGGGGGSWGRGREDRGGGYDLPKPVKVGEEYDVEISEVGSKGDGIARVKNFVVFVNGVKQGEKCKIKITEVRNRFAIGEKSEGGAASEETEAGAEDAVAEESTEETTEAAVEEKSDAEEEA